MFAVVGVHNYCLHSLKKCFGKNTASKTLNVIKYYCLHYPYYRENSSQENDIRCIETNESEDEQEGNSFFLSTEGTDSNR